jgi:very-short-patch-repair endonuclease
MARKVATARNLRQQQTDAERKLWFRLRDRRLHGMKFRRQVPVDRYVVDFCCEAAHLIVELDGGQHVKRNAEDAKRTETLESEGYLVLRLWNHDVLQNIEGVLESIIDTLSPRSPHPDPLPNGEREKKV